MDIYAAKKSIIIKSLLKYWPLENSLRSSENSYFRATERSILFCMRAPEAQKMAICSQLQRILHHQHAAIDVQCLPRDITRAVAG